MDYLAYDMKFKKSNLDATKSALRFLLTITPKDIPLNDTYGVVIPSDIKMSAFCENYKRNLADMISKVGLGVTVGEVKIDGRLLKVNLQFSDSSIETWDLTI